MTKLTKTERALLEKAANTFHGGLEAVTGWSTSSKQGARGVREARALKSLVLKGLADGYKFGRSQARNLDGGGTTHYTEFSAFITEAGHEAIR